MKLLGDTVLGLSVGQKILLTDEQFTLCNIYVQISYYTEKSTSNSLKFQTKQVYLC